MIMLPIAILLFVSIFVLFRIFEKYKIDNLQAIVINYIVAAFIAYFVAEDASDLNMIIDRPDFQYTVLLGIFFMVSFLVFAISAQKAGIAATAIASKISLVIPVTIGIILYPEDSLSATLVGGLLLAAFSFYFVFKQEKGTPFNYKNLIYPLILFALNGMSDSLMKHIRIGFADQIEITLDNQVVTMLILFGSSFTVGAIILFVRQIYQRTPFTLKTIMAGIFLGVLNFGSALTLYISMGQFKGNFFFPVFNISVVLLSALIGIGIFKEKFSKTNYLGIALGIGTILLIAFSEL